MYLTTGRAERFFRFRQTHDGRFAAGSWRHIGLDGSRSPSSSPPPPPPDRGARG